MRVYVLPWLVNVLLLSPGKNIRVTVAAVTLGSDITCRSQRDEPDSIEC